MVIGVEVRAFMLIDGNDPNESADRVREKLLKFCKTEGLAIVADIRGCRDASEVSSGFRKLSQTMSAASVAAVQQQGPVYATGKNYDALIDSLSSGDCDCGCDLPRVPDDGEEAY